MNLNWFMETDGLKTLSKSGELKKKNHLECSMLMLRTHVMILPNEYGETRTIYTLLGKVPDAPRAA